MAQNYLSQHQHSCTQTKKHLSSAISSFKEFANCRKKSRTSSNDIDSMGVTDSSIPLSNSTCLQGRRQNCQLPKRFRDILPQPPPTVPLEVRKLPPPSVGQVMASHETPTSPSHATFHTPPNIFGLVRQYFSSAPPSHDPEEYVTIADLSFIPGSRTVSEEEYNAPVAIASDSQYYPYPNHSSFQLGDWYWNQGVQKSQEDYTHLLKIIGSETFNTADMSSMHWNEINSNLGANKYDQGNIEEWEEKGAGWKRTPVFINVPFSRTTEVPGPRAFQAADLYHRSLVAIIREKLTNA
ncbi:uncharacterized protein EDB93DRAFT_1099607 [Suillus bovinus]|uniref:uncharacterized protein n=1 Tax=Suillus bovinus TaxID=48563 RepID=UPI001B86D529|nr:uncharacterized protein EDB93DRAFT_1099607 [Suillus bovinus]KAG2159195.1 hypothetical protein EDB93DRAFT_1099607 [Suillus bovinus]